MAKRRYYLDTRILTVFFFVAMPFVAFGSFVVVSMARSALQESIGESFEQRAAQTKFLLERYVSDQVVHLRLLSLDPEVRASLSSSRRREGDDAKLREAAARSPLAERLRAVTQVRPAVRLLQVVDADGALVASSSRGGRTRHAESGWFRALAADFPEPRPHVTDVQRAPGSELAVFTVAYPVYDREAGLWLGALLAYLDASDLYGVLAPVRMGSTGHAALIRASDGIVLAADDSERVLRDTFPGFEYVKAATAEARIRSSRWFGRSYWLTPEMREADETGNVTVVPARLIAFSPVEQVPGVEWLVLIEQDLEEATAPIDAVTRYLWIHFIGAFGTIVLLALYFSFKLEAPVIEEGLHLHEQHVPKGMKPATEQE